MSCSAAGREVRRVVADGQQPGVELGVQRLDAAVHDLREAGEVLDRRGPRARPPASSRGGAAGGHELDAELGEPAGEVDDPALVGDRQQRAPDADGAGRVGVAAVARCWRLGDGAEHSGPAPRTPSGAARVQGRRVRAARAHGAPAIGPRAASSSRRATSSRSASSASTSTSTRPSTRLDERRRGRVDEAAADVDEVARRGRRATTPAGAGEPRGRPATPGGSSDALSP